MQHCTLEDAYKLFRLDQCRESEYKNTLSGRVSVGVKGTCPVDGKPQRDIRRTTG